MQIGDMFFSFVDPASRGCQRCGRARFRLRGSWRSKVLMHFAELMGGPGAIPVIKRANFCLKPDAAAAAVASEQYLFHSSKDNVNFSETLQSQK